MMKEREGNRIGKREKLRSNTASTEAPGSPRRSFEDEINLSVVPQLSGKVRHLYSYIDQSLEGSCPREGIGD